MTDSTTLFALIKGLGIPIIGPVTIHVFPDWPQWIAKLFPTHWVIGPIYSAAVRGEGLGDVYVDLLIALAIIVAMVPAPVAATLRLRTRSAAGAS